MQSTQVRNIILLGAARTGKTTFRDNVCTFNEVGESYFQVALTNTINKVTIVRTINISESTFYQVNAVLIFCVNTHISLENALGLFKLFKEYNNDANIPCYLIINTIYTGSDVSNQLQTTNDFTKKFIIPHNSNVLFPLILTTLMADVQLMSSNISNADKKNNVKFCDPLENNNNQSSWKSNYTEKPANHDSIKKPWINYEKDSVAKDTLVKLRDMTPQIPSAGEAKLQLIKSAIETIYMGLIKTNFKNYHYTFINKKWLDDEMKNYIIKYYEEKNYTVTKINNGITIDF